MHMCSGPKPFGALTAPLRKSLADLEKEKEEMRRWERKSSGRWALLREDYRAGCQPPFKVKRRSLTQELRHSKVQTADSG